MKKYLIALFFIILISLFVFKLQSFAYDSQIRTTLEYYFEWVVEWDYVTYISIPCECNEPQYDEFGRQTNADITLAIHCTKKQITHKTKTFDRKEKAEAFIERGKYQIDLYNFKLSCPGYDSGTNN